MNLKMFMQEYDVVVYGATSGAVATAIQSAKLGRSVVLVSPEEHIGTSCLHFNENILTNTFVKVASKLKVWALRILTIKLKSSTARP